MDLDVVVGRVPPEEELLGGAAAGSRGRCLCVCVCIVCLREVGVVGEAEGAGVLVEDD
jgi:hypothetical protein